MKSLSKFFLSFFILCGIVSCSEDDDIVLENPDTENTIAQIVTDDPELSNLLAALETVNLVSDFTTDEDLTLFAPTNAAFTQFLELNGYASLGAVPEDELRELLLNHVIEGENLAADLSTGYSTTFTSSSVAQARLSLFINAQDGVVLNGIAEVDNADNIASNGVVHIVNNVISKPTIVTQADANPELSSLVEALQLAESEDLNFIQLLSNVGNNAPFTVFAPTNAAFDDLIETLGVESLQEVDPEILATVLKYHVITDNNVRLGDLSTGLTAETFQGESLEFDLSESPQVEDASGTNASLIETDIQADNGVMHTIDKVLLPEEVLSIIDPTITGVASTNNDLSSLVSALEYTGLDEVLADRSANFTVFAPNNEAFDSYLNGSEITDFSVEVITQLLLNHVLNEVSFSGDFETSYASTLATYGATENKLSLFVNTSNGILLNGVSSVTTPDNEADNGVIHIVNEVIDLPTIVTFISADPNFSSLLSALTNQDQASQNYVDVLSTPFGATPSPFTVFAPSNQAFDNLLDELQVNSIEDIDPATLTASLNTHVITGFNLRSTGLEDGIITTLGSDLTVNTTEGTLTDPRGRMSTIASFDIQASNGVIHSIDTVLLPEVD
ncbi:fasciclin domain-containing protein [Psychroflexus tropicus]|uniref:fasciclin domain-containing protein n=1 Tax=Psychroflexus tropicus TaxID=197345 RepID=UPI00037F88D7|nr:fasciclin domain-containing protein [Psychroflexus tropicus]